MNESPKPSKLMMKMVVIAALIIIIIGIIFYRSLAAIPFALGVLATSGLNIFKLRMLEKTVQKVIYMDDQEAGKNVIRLQYLLRYLMTGAVLVVIGLIHNYTTPPPFYSSRDLYIAVWAALFPSAPEALLNAPFISMWGALAGIFTLQLSVIIVRSFKLETDGTEFIKYEDDEDTDNNENDKTAEKAAEETTDKTQLSNTEKDVVEDADENNVNS